MAKEYECREKECKDRKISFTTFTAWKVHMLGAHAKHFTKYADYKKK